MMNSEKQSNNLPEYSPSWQQQQEEQAQRRGRWRWWKILLFTSTIGLLTYTQMDNIAWLKRTLAGETEHEMVDLGFPAHVAQMQGPEDLSIFVQDLQKMFGEERGCAHHHKDQVMECGAGHNNPHCGKFSIAFPPEYARHPRPPRRHETFCKPEELLASSSIFTFSPDEYKRAAVYLDGAFSHGGVVTVDRASEDDSNEDIKVNVTTFVGRKELKDAVSISGFDHEGQYSVQVKRKGGHRRSHHKPPVKEDCVTYSIRVVFPSHLESYEDLNLHIKKALRIHTTTELSKLHFGAFKAGVGHGAIHFSDVKADTIYLATLYGVVLGDYSPDKVFASAAVHGASKVKIHPGSDSVNITSAAVVGPASAELPADGFAGNFVVSSWTGSPIVEAPNPDDVHVVKNRYTYKAGYYKEQNTESNVVVSSRHGDSELLFKNYDDDTADLYQFMY
ncbi:hypothetical protein BDA99DRAFT_493926 [Phascolomyces articulosus]|uniref:Uncharacterized protein n=1 Tax=Phascolomyces articulosus TaxID=60185 RepID=A0AAD5KAC8_9FUNG|nr:hypothetical protein BDA99DRAFT_493926 [Phascolomyces articulosus]